jgi:uncharacterized protein (DUF885 family)
MWVVFYKDPGKGGMTQIRPTAAPRPVFVSESPMVRCHLLLTFGLVGVVAFTAGIGGFQDQDPNTPRSFAAFVDTYFDAYFDWKPSEGTAVGLHQYDDKLENRSSVAVARRLLVLKDLERSLGKLRARGLKDDEAIDADVIAGQIQAELLDLHTLDNWRKNPMTYIGIPGGAIDGLMKRNFAPAANRLRLVIARLKAAPALLGDLRTNIKIPPKEFTDLAIIMGEGSVGFFRDSVRNWAKEAAGQDKDLLREFELANTRMLKALEKTNAWLKEELLPRSQGTYAIGAENFAQQLRDEEMVELPLDRLLAIGEANLRRDQEAFIAAAKKIDPNKSPADVLRELAADHPDETDLIPSVRRTLEKTRQFVVNNHIVTIPSEVRPIVAETPPYARNGSFASMDTPGPYESKATEAFYYVTPTEPDWSPRHKDEHLRLFNRPVTEIITIHEAFPGHYIQFLYAKQFPTKTRKLLSCGTNVEGWAHYCEQMIVDQGFGGGNLKVRLAQLSEALWRDCRYVVGIKLHTQGMTVEEGTAYFMKEGFQDQSPSFAEARRGTYNPTYLYYTLGKLQIYKLRDDYRRAQGTNFSLEKFHNEFVRQGGIPIKLIRRILLPGDDGPTL